MSSPWIIRPFRADDEPHVIELWRRCGLLVPHNNPRRDIARKLRVNPEWFLVAEREGAIDGTCLAGYEGRRGWINYLAADPRQQRRGLATQLMQEAERLLRAAGCPKINLQIRAGNEQVIAFYQSLGFAVDAVTCLGKRLEVDEPLSDVAKG